LIPPEKKASAIGIMISVSGPAGMTSLALLGLDNYDKRDYKK
jgi:hypothetical protein